MQYNYLAKYCPYNSGTWLMLVLNRCFNSINGPDVFLFNVQYYF